MTEQRPAVGLRATPMESIKVRIASAARFVAASAAKVPYGARWSFLDQMLVSGVNVLTGIVLVRALGLHDFGVFSLATLVMLFLNGVQVGVTSPMMSLFDRRGSIDRSSYLATVLLHQAVVSGGLVVLIVLAPTLFPQLATVAPFDFYLVAAVLAASQFQDLSRRFFYVTERPARAFLSDIVAYGFRLAIIIGLAIEGTLTIDRVWIVMIATFVAATLFLLPDFLRWNATWQDIKEVTRRHMSIAGWMIGNTMTWWFTESGFILLVVGTTLGPVQLGAARAVQNLVSLANPFVLSLENFAPSAATKAFVAGGPSALLRYVRGVALLGSSGLLLLTATLTIFVDPILHLVYGQTFPHAAAITAILGTCVAIAYSTSVCYAGLRALEQVRDTFFFQAVMGAICLAAAWSVAADWGVVGALSALLAVRLTMLCLFALSLRRHARAAVKTAK